MHERDIVIVGGGPAGLSTWLHLHDLDPRLAARAVVVERERLPRDKLCGGGVTGRADGALRALGVEVDVPSAPVDVVELRLARETVRLRVPGVFRVVRRAAFDAELARIAVARGLELREGIAFRGLAPRDGRVRVDTSAGPVACRVVVAADGAASRVRRAAGVRDASRVARLMEVFAPDAPRCAPRAAVFDFTACAEGLQGYTWEFPYPTEGCTGRNIGVFDSRVHGELHRAELPAILRRTLDELGAHAPRATWRGAPLRWYAPDAAMAAPHVVLVGDAAGAGSALGEGISRAIEYGGVAAAAIADALHAGDLSFADYGDRVAASALGRTLRLEHGLASYAYAEPATALGRIKALLAMMATGQAPAVAHPND